MAKWKGVYLIQAYICIQMYQVHHYIYIHIMHRPFVPGHLRVQRCHVICCDVWWVTDYDIQLLLVTSSRG